MDLDKTSEARRKAQRNGEEDPFVVAQRFLNIYRQIHIFNNEKKQAFNKMLLELSPQIRGMFGQMPGGALLQDYVDELAEQEGIEKSIQTPQVDIANEDVRQAKILATALADAQIQASTKMQEFGIGNPNMNAVQITPPVSGPSTLSLDKNFAEDFAAAMSNVIHQNTENQNTQFANILGVLEKFQAENIKILQQQNENQQAEIKQIAQILADKNKDTKETENHQLITFLLDNQKQLNEKIDKITISPDAMKEQIAMLWHRSEQNMGKLVAFLNEKQRRDSLEVAKMVNESQQKLWNMIVQNNTLNQNSGNASANNNIQIMATDYSAVLNSIAEKLGALNSAPPKIELNFPEQAFGEMMKAQSQIYRQIAIEQTQELSKIIASVIKENKTLATPPLVDALDEKNLPHLNNDYEAYHENDIDLTNEESATKENETLKADDLKKKKKKKKKKKAIAANPLFSSIFASANDTDDEYEEDIESPSHAITEQETEIITPTDDTNILFDEKSDSIDFSFDDVNNTQLENDLNDFVQNATNYEYTENTETEKQENLENEITKIFDWTFEQDDNNTENLFTEPTKDMASDWGFSEEQKPTLSDETNDDNNDWEWEYIEDTDSITDNDETALSPIAQNCLIKSGDLFFQQSILPSENNLKKTSLRLNKIPVIVDSVLDDFNNGDPYKNSVIKD